LPNNWFQKTFLIFCDCFIRTFGTNIFFQSLQTTTKILETLVMIKLIKNGFGKCLWVNITISMRRNKHKYYFKYFYHLNSWIWTFSRGILKFFKKFILKKLRDLISFSLLDWFRISEQFLSWFLLLKSWRTWHLG